MTEVTIECPECGSIDIWLLDDIRIENDYLCYHCDHAWKKEIEE